MRLVKSGHRYGKKGTMILVEKATEQELESIWALDRMVIGNSSRKDFLADTVGAGRCWLAHIGDTVAGLGVLEQSFYGQGFISLLVTHPNYRRCGVATSLIHHLESICPTEKLFTSTNKSNLIAQRVYETLGFVRSGYIENLDEGDPEIIYFKRFRGDSA